MGVKKALLGGPDRADLWEDTFAHWSEQDFHRVGFTSKGSEIAKDKSFEGQKESQCP
jgi:hypothetical protein